MLYHERLSPPLSWWLLTTAAVVAAWLTVETVTPPRVTWIITAVVGAALYGLMFILARTTVRIEDATLFAGPAHIAVDYIGEVTALDQDQTQLLMGRDANPQAFLVTKPYIKQAVKVTITDPRDPTPYWLISSRQPQLIAQALLAATAR